MPKYASEVDPWGWPYLFFVRKNGQSYEIRSLGPSGAVSFAIKGDSTDPHVNLVYSDGNFTAYPHGWKHSCF